MDLPRGLRTVRPSPDRAEQVLALVAAYNQRMVGSADYTLDDVQADLSAPGFDPERDGWLVLDGSDTAVGYGWSSAEIEPVTGEAEDEPAGVDIDVVASDPAVAEWLLAAVLDRSRERARDAGRGRVGLTTGTYRSDVTLQETLAGRGFAPTTTFQRLRIDHAGPLVEPDPPAGVRLRRGPGDDALRRDAYAVDAAAFVEHFGESHPPTYERWVQRTEAGAGADWGQLLVADLDGRPVGMLLGNDQFVEDEGCGYVRRIGVVPEARGRGIAGYLLRVAFARDAAAGRAGTLLHVDTNNTTPALGLYQGVGMRVVLVIDMWQLTIDA